MKLNSATAVQSTLRVKIDGVRLFLGQISTKAFALPIMHYSGLIFPAFRRLYSKKSGSAGFAGAFDVLHIAGSAYVSKVADSIVSAISVYVVNIVERKVTMNKGPCSSMRPTLLIVNTQAPIKPINPSGFPAVSGENSGVWIVVKKFAQTLCGKIGLSHDALLMLIGQRPGSVDALVPASSF